MDFCTSASFFYSKEGITMDPKSIMSSKERSLRIHTSDNIQDYLYKLGMIPSKIFKDLLKDRRILIFLNLRFFEYSVF